MKKHIQNLLEKAIYELGYGTKLPTNKNINIDHSKSISNGDYATNIAMILATSTNLRPRELASEIVDHLPDSELISKVVIAGPGFINFFINPNWLSKQIDLIFLDERANVKKVNIPKTIVIDYSSPNIAKEMHVGHIRSTIIGDAIARTLDFLGHHVIRANHIGDWGTQFGMLICHLEEIEKQKDNLITSNLSDLEEFYRDSKKRYDEDDNFSEQARNYVVRLQSGDEYCLKKWQQLVDITLKHNYEIYERLNVTLTKEDIMGESMYNPMLKGIVEDLKKKNIASQSDGATVVYLDEFKGKDGKPLGIIIQKSDGGYLYTTTDIACAKYRHEVLHADRVLYFIDSRQHQHLLQAWAITRKAGYVPDNLSLEHHAFGMMLGNDGKPFKTRAGGTVKLIDLLDEAEDRAAILLKRKSNNQQSQDTDKIRKAIAIGAVKYADLSKNRTTDYIFDWDNMLKFEGNTAPYLQYAYARIQSIFRKSSVNKMALVNDISLDDEAEEALAKQLILLSETIQRMSNDGMPHYLCGYLFDLAKAFMHFYERCPINKDGVTKIQKMNRLKLCAVTAKTLKIGLSLLGIEVLDRM